MVRSLTCHHPFLTMQGSVPTCHDRFLHMSSSVPSCHGQFRSIGVGGAGDVIVAEDGSSREVVSVVSVAVREVGNAVLVMSNCHDVTERACLKWDKFFRVSEMFVGCSG